MDKLHFTWLELILGGNECRIPREMVFGEVMSLKRDLRVHRKVRWWEMGWCMWFRPLHPAGRALRLRWSFGFTWFWLLPFHGPDPDVGYLGKELDLGQRASLHYCTDTSSKFWQLNFVGNPLKNYGNKFLYSHRMLSITYHSYCHQMEAKRERMTPEIQLRNREIMLREWQIREVKDFYSTRFYTHPLQTLINTF